MQLRMLIVLMQTMLIKYEVFSEDVTRFYMAECCLAIEAVHNLGFIHRFVPQLQYDHLLT
jgi:serine/threonine protein kinase